MKFYTNVQLRGNFIYYRGYENGRRISEKRTYNPYYFIPTKQPSNYKTLDGRNVDKISFGNFDEARSFVKRYEEVSNFEIFGFNKFAYTYIRDEYPDQINYDLRTIKTFNLDIECDSKDGFPDIDTANKPLTLIGCKVGYTRTIFGLKDYRPKDDTTRYIKCYDEVEMCHKFLDFWTETDPDVVTGWNIEKFDIPYLINRFKRILSNEDAKRLSPWKVLQEKTVEIYGKDHLLYSPLGVAVLDYYDLYRKFTYTQLESYRLDHVAFVETGRGKLDYSEYDSLNELYEQNFEKYVDYNIVDLDRVSEIDDKNKFIELVFAIAYDAKINYQDALTSVLLWDVIIHNYLMDKNIVVPLRGSGGGVHDTIQGAYVKDPHVGGHSWVVSFDLTSLYPHLIMQYNISPETLREMVAPQIDNILEGRFDASEIKRKNLTQAANGCRYDRSKRGFLADLMELQFKQRVEYKNKMLDAKKKFEETGDTRLENDIARYNNAQMAKKIQLNSAYGAIANPHFRYYDVRNAEAITVSGQLSTRWVENKLNKFFNDMTQKDYDYVIAADTDSVYLNFGALFTHLKQKPSQDLINTLCNGVIQKFINKTYEELSQIVNAYTNAMKMKREAIADKGIWTAKKRYILNVLDNEGVVYHEPKLKMMGIEAIRSSTPSICKEYITEALKIIMASDNERPVQQYIEQCRHNHRKLGFEDIAFPRGVNGMDKYRDAVTIFKKATPIHVKASLIYNDQIKKRGLTHKYPLIHDSDKIKWVYLKEPNTFFSSVIGAQRTLPPQFNVEQYIDYDKMFQKSFLDPIENILNCIGWKAVKVQTLEDFFN